MKEHIITLVGQNLQESNKENNCGICQSPCQSACKTSCTVSNQKCVKEA